MRTDQFTLGQGDEGESNGFIQTQRRRLSHSEGIINEPRRGPVSLEDEEIREGTEAPSNKQSCPAIEQEVSGVSAVGRNFQRAAGCSLIRSLDGGALQPLLTLRSSGLSRPDAVPLLPGTQMPLQLHGSATQDDKGGEVGATTGRARRDSVPPSAISKQLSAADHQLRIRNA